ncbi:MAG: dTMP kinase [Armatimonadetes bacterium]|nr:dTMP kinase [Armatimonadota bacterium]
MFVTFEGPEGAGKSTALRAVAARLGDSGHEVVTTREPGAGEFGRAVREIMLHGEHLDPKAELFLFLADRAQHTAGTIRPALVAGKIVLCDRYADSTVVYQGHARGLDVAELRRLNDLATGGLVPDLTLLLDLDVQAGLDRQSGHDRLDSEPDAFHQKVREGYLSEAVRDTARWKKIDASQPPEAVSELCWEAVRGSPAFPG